MRIPRAALSLLTLALLAAGCSGGGDDGSTGPQTGTISGSVTAGGSGVGGATVSLGTTATQTTSASGGFQFLNVPAGSHTLGVTLPAAFQLAAGEPAQKTVSVQAGRTASLSWSAQAAPAAGTVDTVRLTGTSFVPENLTIARGRTVVWVNTQALFHTITPDGHTQWSNVNTNSVGEALRVTFTTAGTFNYFCQPHRSLGMTGSIRVQ